MSAELLYFNGIDGSTGQYLVPPMTAETLAAIVRGEQWDPAHLDELRWRHEQDSTRTYALKEGLDPKNLAEAGWGVIFAANVDPSLNAAIREALSELLDLRRAQAGPLYREFMGSAGYRPEESKNDFLARHGAGPGPVDPAKVPYYLLIVGDPQTIPYRFQYELDVAYAVGRIHFGSLDDYARYARSVALAESGKVMLPRRAVFFGTSNPDDQATTLSAAQLVEPLAFTLAANQPYWDIQSVIGEPARKARLSNHLGGSDTPALFFSASHGMGFPNGDPRQLPFQGALLCQDWPGPKAGLGEIRRDYFFGGEDLASDANLLGTIAFHFACYGAGTPYWDDFAKLAFKSRTAVAPHAFVAALPQRMLALPKGGALAVVGHVERAWTFSFNWDKAGAQTLSFESTLTRLMENHPIGSALDYLNSRYAEISTMLSNALEEAEYTKPNPYKLANLWTAHNDARGYALIGDPAVRLPVVPAGSTIQAQTARPAIQPIDGGKGKVPVVLSSQLPDAPAPAQPSTPSGPSDSVQPGQSSQPAQGELVAESLALWSSDSLKQLRENLSDTLRKLTDRLSQLVDDITSLEVSTFVAESMDDIRYDSRTHQFSGGARLRALTHISLDGDVQICVPVESDEIDSTLWEIHRSMVEQAQANRAEIFRITAEVLGNLLLPGQGK